MNDTSHANPGTAPNRRQDRRVSAPVDGRKAASPHTRTTGVGTILAIWIVGVFLASNLALAQSRVDIGCTHGDLKCTADILLVCQCYEEWMETEDGEELLTFCVWEDTEEYCGEDPEPVQHPPCTRNYVGATFEFPDEVKVCKCHEESGCAWEKDY